MSTPSERGAPMITPIELAGVGQLYVLQTVNGDQVGFVAGRGRCWLVVYDRADPDAAVVSVELTGREAADVVELIARSGLVARPAERVIVVETLRDGLDALAD